MKRFKNLVIGGIQSKIFNLILYTVLLLTIAYMAVSIYHSNMLARLATESSAQQQASIGDLTDQVMDSVVETSLERTNRVGADIANAIFENAAQRVTFVADVATRLLAHPEDYEAEPYVAPHSDVDGDWTANLFCADGVDPADPTVAARLRLLDSLSDTLISLCPAVEASSMYVAVPEGVHLSVSKTSSSWFTDGKVITYDPRQRDWYQRATEAGTLVFTDGENDAKTGVYCIECAKPVYGPDGSLQAVVGTDLYLDLIQQVMENYSVEGEYGLLINQDGLAVLEVQEEAFPMADADRGRDLRDSRFKPLAQAVDSALQGNAVNISLGDLEDGSYYITAAPVRATGWVLVTVFQEEIARQPATLLRDSNTQIQADIAGTYRQNTEKSRMTAVVLLCLVTLLTLTGALVLGGRIVKPLNTITRRISELSEGNMEFRMEDAYRTGDEVEELAQSFATISHRTIDYMDKVVKVTAEKERIGTELSLAKDIQAAMLPHIFPAFPDRAEFDIFASMDPAKEVGGDFYDYFLVDDDHLCMIIADVSGKGVPGALFMMASKIILQSVAMLGNSPAEILAKTNDAICSNNEAQMFVTVWLGILELSTGKLTAANAGHEYPVLKHPGGAFELYKDRHGFVIGGMEDVRYQEYEIQMAPGTKLFVYTDGVPEAIDAEKEPFGTERMIAALNARSDVAPMEVLKNVRGAVDGFVKDAERFDDLTMLCLEYRGKAEREADA